jgi:hypothetical protein
MYSYNEKGCYNVDLTKVNEQLCIINQKLHEKCSNLHISCNNYYNMTGTISIFNIADGLVLCLYKDDECISSISIEYMYKDTVEMSSKTSMAHTGKKYNKFLRTVLFTICPYITCNEVCINKIVSDAINPITAWSLIGYYDTTYISDPSDVYSEFKKENSDLDVKQLIFKAYANGVTFEITIELTADNIAKSNALLNKLLLDAPNSLIC